MWIRTALREKFRCHACGQEVVHTRVSSPQVNSRRGWECARCWSIDTDTARLARGEELVDEAKAITSRG